MAMDTGRNATVSTPANTLTKRRGRAMTKRGNQ
jgi:hypothetical protein